ncbi:MAG TPA: type IV pilus assembly protein PilM [Chthoniobacterales bacterium]|nr:type IV pilus assembly protein PilM [Chthoniobacterales bacterium]
MSPRTRIITLNLGSQSIELAEFRAQPPGGLILCRYLSRDVFVEPASKGITPAQVTAAVGDMLRELQITSGDVNYTIAEECVFSRFVELPAIGQEKTERIIAFEAQQNVPFPLEEVVWDYQLVGGGAGQQIEVVLVAVKAEVLDEINRAVEATGLRTRVVDLATMAVYNAFQFSYGELNGCSLLVDIGARTTNLLFVEPGKIFTRSVPLGGSSATAAIVREFGESFAAAEIRKKRNPVAGSNGEEPSTNEDAARVAKITQNLLGRLHAEVTRSIGHYCSQQRGNRPEHVFLAGGVAGTPGILEFFQEKLQLPVDFFDPLRKVAIAGSAALDPKCRHLLGEPVGLALRAAHPSPMKLNLRPSSVARRQELERRRPYFVLAAACFVLGLLSWGAYFSWARQAADRATARLQEKVEALQRIERQLNGVRKETGALDGVSGPLVAAINDRNFWPQIIEDLNARLPREDIWITELVPTSNGKEIASSDHYPTRPIAAPMPAVSPLRPGTTPSPPALDGLLVRGLYLFNPRQQEVVVDYFRNLVESPWFAIDPNNQAKVIKPATPNETEWAFPYELRLDLRKAVSLP